jgi:hypothetical protein
MAHLFFCSRTLAFVPNMSEKCKSTSPSAIQIKNLWKKIGIEEKLRCISHLEKGEQIADICHNVRHAHNSICTVRDNADRMQKKC